MHWTTTIFIISLAVSDLLYCAISLPLYAMQYLSKRWVLGETLCYATTAFRYINAFADWMSVGMFSHKISMITIFGHMQFLSKISSTIRERILTTSEILY